MQRYLHNSSHMKSLLPFFILLMFVLPARADEFTDKYGNGVLHIEGSAWGIITMYSSPNSKPTHTLAVIRNSTYMNPNMIQFDKIKPIDSLPTWFSCLFLRVSDEEPRIDIVAIDSASGFYRTILKDNEGREVWIKKDTNTTFLPWFDFYKTMSSIEVVSEELILYAAPTLKSKPSNHTDKMHNDEQRAYMKPIEVKGFWMKVELHVPNLGPDVSETIYTGWIQWRNEKEPLIEYNRMGC